MKDFSPSARRRSLVLAAHLVILAATIAVYARAPFLDFVDFDDFLYIFDNPWVLRGLTPGGVEWAWAETHGGYYAPLLWLSYMLDVTLFGPGAWGHHLTNVVLHAANAMLVLELLRRAGAGLGGATIVALWFAVHPVQVESVAWITERKNVLSLLLGLVAIGAYGAWTQQPSRRLYLLSLSAATASLLVKATFVTLPFLLLLLDIWPLRRLEPSLRPATLGPRLREKIPFFGLALLGAVATYVAQEGGGAVAGFGYLGFEARFENAVVSYSRYLGNLLWPGDLAAIYPFPSLLGEDMWSARDVAASLGLLAALSAGAVWLRKEVPAVLVGWLWFVGSLVPMIGLVQVGDQSMTDRHLYLPGLGVGVAAVVGLRAAWLRWSPPVRALPVVLGVALLAAGLGWKAARQVETWRDTLTLFEHAVAVTDRNWIALNNVAWLRATCPGPTVRDPERAVRLAEEACRITRRGEPELLDTLAVAYASAGRWDTATAAGREALGLAVARGDEGATRRFRERLTQLERRIPVSAERGCPRAVLPADEIGRNSNGSRRGAARKLLKAEGRQAEAGSWTRSRWIP